MNVYYRFFLLSFCIFFSSLCFAQQKVKRVAVFDIDLSEFRQKQSLLGTLFMIDLLKPNALSSIPEYLIKAYSSNAQFSVIDKLNYDLVADERERQKSEDFIDGYVIAQGKSEGIDYLMRPRYNQVDHTISIRVYDVSTGEVFCEANTELVKNKVGREHTNHYISKLMEQLNNTCFDVRYLVVRAIEEKKGKAKELLIAAGKNHLMQEKKEIEIFERQEIEVEGRKLFRPFVLGECEIVEVEGADFSRAKVTSGGEIILKKLNSGTEIYCRTKAIK